MTIRFKLILIKIDPICMNFFSTEQISCTPYTKHAMVEIHKYWDKNNGWDKNNEWDNNYRIPYFIFFISLFNPIIILLL